VFKGLLVCGVSGSRLPKNGVAMGLPLKNPDATWPVLEKINSDEN
jgi:hypothetical protein